MSIIKIGLYPFKESDKFKRLFLSLKQIFPIDFIDIEKEDNIENIIFFKEDLNFINKFFYKAKNLLFFNSILEFNSFEDSTEIIFSNSNYLDPILNNRILKEIHTPIKYYLKQEKNDEILASCNEKPIWIKRKHKNIIINILSIKIEELKSDEVIWREIQNGRFITLLPILHFFKKVISDKNWIFPPLRATFIIDDPNLHFSKYGNLNYEKIVSHAKQHNYHVSIGIVPIDMNYANKKAVKIFKENQSYISLMIHGVKHLKKELFKERTIKEALEYFSYALKKIEKFEKKYNLNISRTVVPPHGKVSQNMVKALLLLGLEALYISARPYPWTFEIPKEDLLAGIFPSTLVEGGFPIIQRASILQCNNDLNFVKQDQLLRAFLKQPIVLYGHNEDFFKGLDLFKNVANYINSFRKVNWCSSQEITRTNYLIKIEGKILLIKLMSRFIQIKIPDHIENIKVIKHGIIFNNEGDNLQINKKYFKLNEIIPLKEIDNIISNKSNKNLNIKLIHTDSLNYRDFKNPMFDFIASMRRILCELRDRLKLR